MMDVMMVLIIVRPLNTSSLIFAFVRYWEDGKVRLDYRPVHMNTLDDEVEAFPPKARTY